MIEKSIIRLLSGWLFGLTCGPLVLPLPDPRCSCGGGRTRRFQSPFCEHFHTHDHGPPRCQSWKVASLRRDLRFELSRFYSPFISARGRSIFWRLLSPQTEARKVKDASSWLPSSCCQHGLPVDPHPGNAGIPSGAMPTYHAAGLRRFQVRDTRWTIRCREPYTALLLRSSRCRSREFQSW